MFTNEWEIHQIKHDMVIECTKDNIYQTLIKIIKIAQRTPGLNLFVPFFKHNLNEETHMQQWCLGNKPNMVDKLLPTSMAGVNRWS